MFAYRSLIERRVQGASNSVNVCFCAKSVLASLLSLQSIALGDRTSGTQLQFGAENVTNAATMVQMTGQYRLLLLQLHVVVVPRNIHPSLRGGL